MTHPSSDLDAGRVADRAAALRALFEARGVRVEKTADAPRNLGRTPEATLAELTLDAALNLFPALPTTFDDLVRAARERRVVLLAGRRCLVSDWRADDRRAPALSVSLTLVLDPGELPWPGHRPTFELHPVLWPAVVVTDEVLAP